MTRWPGDKEVQIHLAPVMGRLARMPAFVATLGGAITLLLLVILDNCARDSAVRLVPLYVPVLCIVCWMLNRRMAVLFAVAAALIAVLPDLTGPLSPGSLATAINTVIRIAAYVFLALIIVALRGTYDDADLRAMHDGLTGVLNKVSFHAAASRAIATARRSHRTLLFAYVDLDGFKAVNTHYGHAAGDTALQSFARDAKDAVRGADLVGRLGGDEFGFLLTVSAPQTAEALARLLHRRLIATLAETGLPLSCSMGALIVPPPALFDEAELCDAADRMMRKAKAEGKSRVVIRSVVGTTLPRDDD